MGIVGYKHISSIYADSFAQGSSIQLGLYSTYRSGEGDRVDPLEGRTINHIEHKTLDNLPGQSDPSQDALLRQLGINTAGPFRGLTLEKMTICVSSQEAYVFCCSLEPDERRLGSGETIFEIHDLNVFAHRLAKASNGILANPRIDRVQYRPRVGDPFEHGFFNPDPFTKDVKFEAERELRIIWQIYDKKRIEPYLRLTAPRAAKLIKPWPTLSG